MPKSQFVDPNKVFAKDKIVLKSIPQNEYCLSDFEERKIYGDETLLNIYCDMVIIREFETMLHLLKTSGEYHGIEFFYAGPAHLSIGQEAAAVGQAFLLNEEDFIFGSHRGHSEFLAKALSCIRKMEEGKLNEIIRNYNDGLTWSVMQANGLVRDTAKGTAVLFLIFSMISEMLAKETGFNRGLGGSMHAFCLPFGIYPNNAIVGGQADIATGAALYKKINRQTGVVIANLGDGSSTCGNVWEAMNMAAMDQYDMLWDEAFSGGLPIIFNFVNNQYSMGDQPCGETTGMRELARIGAAINPAQMHAIRLNGNNPLAVIDSMKESIDLIKAKKGPILHDVLTYRFSGHSPSDPFSYRTKEEVEAWETYDPIKLFAEKLFRLHIADEAGLNQIKKDTIEILTMACRIACDDNACGRIDLKMKPDYIADLMFSNEKNISGDPSACDISIKKEDNPRVAAIEKKDRKKYERNVKVSKNKIFQLRDGIFEAILDGFYKYPSLISYGEGVRDWGGAFAVYRGLMESLPYHRLFNAPIAEGAIVSTAVGYAMAGGKAIVELMYFDFLGRAGDQVFNQLSKWQAMSAGVLKMPVIVRTSIGSKYGAQHSQDWTSLVAHIPGLKVVYPVTPYDSKGIMNTALSGSDPVVFIESQKLYDVHEQFNAKGVPAGYYEVEIGEPDIKREGEDITILSVGATLYRVLEAADILKRDYKLSTEVIDARSIVPFNYETVVSSVKKTGRIIVLGDMCERSSILCDFAKNIGELAFDYLDAPVVTVGARNWITPAFEFEEYFYPQKEWILDVIHQKILPLPGYVQTHNHSEKKQIQNALKGV